MHFSNFHGDVFVGGSEDDRLDLQGNIVASGTAFEIGRE